MFAVVNAAGEVFYGAGDKPAIFETAEQAGVVASYFEEAYGPLSVKDQEGDAKVAKAFADVVEFAAPGGMSADEVAKVVTPEVVAANAGRIYDWMTENGWDQDSWSRELLFTYASLALGVDYDVFYDAWLAEKPAVVPAA